MRRMTAHGDNPSFTRAYRHRERRHIAGSVGTVGFEFEFDLGDVADEAARGKSDPDVFDVDPRDPFGLFDRLAHRRLGRDSPLVQLDADICAEIFSRVFVHSSLGTSSRDTVVQWLC